jgi:SAM-dependent methyltransferase
MPSPLAHRTTRFPMPSPLVQTRVAPGGSALTKSRPPFASVFLVSLAVVMYEIALTQVFSVVLQYHFAFFAISMAICGLGLGGLWLHEWRRRHSPTAAFLPLAALAFAGTGVLACVLLIEWLFVWHLHAYWLAALLLLVPFGCAGAFLAEAFARHSDESGRLYGADLLGAAIAVAAVIAVLQVAGGINACLLATTMATLAALCCGGSRGVRHVSFAAAAFGTLFAAGNIRYGFLDIRPTRLSSTAEASPAYAQRLFAQLSGPAEERPRRIATHWDAFSRLDVVDSPHLGELRSDVQQVFTNGNVPTFMYKLSADLRVSDVKPAVDPLVTASLFPAIARLPFERQPRERVLCIGPGGGMDILLALRAGAKLVEGAEVNPGMLSLMRRHGDYIGHLYDRPDVRVVAAEGRSYLQQSGRSYDLIYMALTQTGIGSQGVALVESYLYTVEAFRTYWRHLAPGGELALVIHNPLFALRFVNTAAAMLKAEGYSDAESAARMAIIGGGSAPYVYVFLLQKGAYTLQDAHALRHFVREHDLRFIHTPPLTTETLGDVLGGSQSIEAAVATIVATYPEPASLAACGDDRPFFMDLDPKLPRDFVVLCLGAAALVLGFSTWVLLTRRHDSRIGKLPSYIGYFSCLGAGFMLVEIPLIQKLTLPLEHPTLALSITILVLLAGGGLGAMASQRLAEASARWAMAFAAATALLTVGFSAALWQPDWLLRLPRLARIGVIIAGLLPLGFCMGTLFPIALRRLGATNPAAVPWMWGVNGMMSVVGSLGAILIAKLWGFSATLMAGALCYAGIGLFSRHWARSSRS